MDRNVRQLRPIFQNLDGVLAGIDANRDHPTDTLRLIASALRVLLTDPAFAPTGDRKKMVRIIVASIDEAPVPKRIVLGADSYTMIHKALSERLASVEAQREQARPTDYT